jgi:hypothetical protein
MDDFDDCFEPLTESELTAAQAGDDAPKDEGVCEMPVPSNAPPMPSEHPKLGKPSARWPYNYRDASGALLFEVWRFDPPGGKEFRPLSLRRYQVASNGAGRLFRSQGRSMAWTGSPSALTLP